MLRQWSPGNRPRAPAVTGEGASPTSPANGPVRLVIWILTVVQAQWLAPGPIEDTPPPLVQFLARRALEPGSFPVIPRLRRATMWTPMSTSAVLLWSGGALEAARSLWRSSNVVNGGRVQPLEPRSLPGTLVRSPDAMGPV